MKSNNSGKVLDCTLRDGGYYNNWDFELPAVEAYLNAMAFAGVDIVELGFRFRDNTGFKGPFAFTTDHFLGQLSIPESLEIGVMINAADLLTADSVVRAVQELFPLPANLTRVSLVRIATHFHEYKQIRPAIKWLNDRGYKVGLNLMQISEQPLDNLATFSSNIADWPLEVLYFADSLGSLTPECVRNIVGRLRAGWPGDIGIHTHDNMGLALSNTLTAIGCGAAWVDATVQGMGRGPGNARVEELLIELNSLDGRPLNLAPLLRLISEWFRPLLTRYKWGTNVFYFLAGKYGIHPTYIQEMLGDKRYSEEDILSVIDHLRDQGGRSFSYSRLSSARQFYVGKPRGTWTPSSVFRGKDILLLGTGPGVSTHRPAIVEFIKKTKPIVVALNAQSILDSSLIDMRIACHPVRLLADASAHSRLPQPLIAPASMLPKGLRSELGPKKLLDFGLGVKDFKFEFNDKYCIAPNALVLSYALATMESGQAGRIYMAGFDGYDAGDERNDEVEAMFDLFSKSVSGNRLVSITPTKYKNLSSISVYAL